MLTLYSKIRINVYYYYRPQRSWGKVIFSEACVNNSVHRGGMHGCTRGGVHGCTGGHVWFYSGCVHGFNGGACVVLFGGCVVLFGGHAWFYLGGHVWFYSGHAWFYSAAGGGMHGFFSFFGYNEIRSMSGRYASYWNAFFLLLLKHKRFQACCRTWSTFVTRTAPI